MAKEEKASVWSSYTEADKEALEKLAAGYRDFLSTCKTERESVREAVRQAEGAGYRDLQDVLRSGEKLKAGDKGYAVNMKKSIVLFQIGEEPLEQGLAILGAHIDTCRLDVKQNPLYEDGGLAYLDTHYYGGIKKYQWVTLPLALHGVVVKKDGTVVEICIGEAEGDPVFCVTDLLIHLSQEQMKKNAAKVIEGEDLDILVGTILEHVRPAAAVPTETPLMIAAAWPPITPAGPTSSRACSACSPPATPTPPGASTRPLPALRAK